MTRSFVSGARNEAAQGHQGHSIDKRERGKVQIAVEAVVFLAALRRWLRGEPGAEPWRAKPSLSVAAASDQSQNNFGNFAKIKVGSALGSDWQTQGDV
ncbi:hypothetical protein [Achromobacter xylosoxidans]|uniref:hypothetical protein n=1 Tax=Alcaligenes xylosoxydans xylosoxydans TaxID=85698 RepID=UPI001EEBCA1C|nr:hypothetical protein [Achromobacter xylosoxidans]